MWELPAAVTLHERLHAALAPSRLRLYRGAALASLLALGILLLRRDTRLQALALAALAAYAAAIVAAMGSPLYRYAMILEPIKIAALAAGAIEALRWLHARGRALGALRGAAPDGAREAAR